MIFTAVRRGSTTASGCALFALALALHALIGRTCGFAADEPPQEETRNGSVPPGLPRRLSLEAAWDALAARTGAEAARAAEEILKESAAGEGLLPLQKSCYTSFWFALDRYVSSQGAGVVASLRRTHDAAVGVSARQADPNELFRLYRRYPWADSCHRALVAFAEDALRRGWPGLALRSFRDVVNHARDPSIVTQARVGMWLGLLGTRAEPRAIEAAFTGVDPDTVFPWFADHLPARAIKERLRRHVTASAAPPSDRPALSALSVKALCLPPVLSWRYRQNRNLSSSVVDRFPSPLGQLQVRDGRVLVSGPECITCFDSDNDRPLWSRARSRVRGTQDGSDEDEEDYRRHQLLPGPFLPCVAGGRVYTRWGRDPKGRFLGVAAFDLETGDLAWSTVRTPGWRGMAPVSDPAVAEGRVYVLALGQTGTGLVPMFLVCLDAQSGTIFWNRLLGSGASFLPDGRREGRDRRNGVDVAHYGNAVTVHRGSVYCSTNMGIVARCDARDGLVEWLYQYEDDSRLSAGRRDNDILTVAGRRGAAPLVLDDRVLFTTRDRDGVFCLDAVNGSIRWEKPAVPSEELIGLFNGTLLLMSRYRLVALDGTTGDLLWDLELPDPIRGRPQIAGSTILVRSGDALLQVNAETGVEINERAWGPHEPFEEFVLTSGSIVGTTWASVWVEDDSGVTTVLPTRARPPELPLSEIWRLQRVDPWIVTPPDTANAPDMVYVLSRGILDALAVKPTPAVIWRRFMPPDLIDLVVTQDAVLFIHRRRVVAFDTARGSLRWQTDVPFAIRDYDLFGPYLLVGNLYGRHEARRAGMILAGTGELLWDEPFGRGTYDYRAWDGERLHLLLDGVYRKTRDRFTHLTVNPTDGTVKAVSFPPGDRHTRIRRIACGDTCAFYRGPDKMIWEYSFLDRTAAPRSVDAGEFYHEDAEDASFSVTGPWLRCARRYGSRDTTSTSQCVLRRGDPSYVLSWKNPGHRAGFIRGDTLFDLADRSVTVIDLPAKQTMLLELPFNPDAGESSNRVLDVRERGEELWVLSGVDRDRESETGNSRLRLDVFSKETGGHVASQVFNGIPQARLSGWGRARQRRGERRRELDNQLVLAGDLVIVTDREGLHILGSAPGKEDQTTFMAYALAGPVTVDGVLKDWKQERPVTLTGADGREATLYLGHDEVTVYLALRYHDPFPVAGGGITDAGGGDWLEVALTTSTGSHRWGIGFDATGRAVAAAPPRRHSNDHEAPPPDAELRPLAAVQHEVADHTLAYELAVPIDSITERWRGNWRRIGVSVAVWDERPTRQGSVCAFRWGGGLRGPNVIPGAHHSVYLHPELMKADEAADRALHAMPSLPVSFELFRESSRARAASWQDHLDRYAAFMKRHPATITAERLCAVDRALRVGVQLDPCASILRVAEAAGVPARERERYRRQAGAYLSQWVYNGSRKDAPRSIVIRLFDGLGPDRKAHGGYIYKLYDGGMKWLTRLKPTIPRLTWHELRMPLIAFDMADTPLCGISFVQQGRPQLVWDRTAVVAGGRDEVFIDDSLPEGTVLGTWLWDVTPVKSGTTAHANPTPAGDSPRYDVQFHGIRDMTAPVARHVVPVPGAPYLSQRVYLDPAAKPALIAVNLSDGRTWRARCLWGTKTVAGRFMGSLPEPGTWHELRVPLVWTPFAVRPIMGVAFGAQGGRAYWGRTAVVVAGKEHGVVAGDAPPVQAEGVVGLLTGKLGSALVCDGKETYVEAAHRAELEPARLTVEAWIYLEELPRNGDRRRWIANKTKHECTGGHYGLAISGDRPGAYLNFGEGNNSEGRYEAWGSGPRLRVRRWHHLAMTYDEADLKVYLDGEEVASHAINLPRRLGDGPLRIGRRVDGYTHFKGLIDEVCLYGRALSVDELTANMRAVEAARPGFPVARVQEGLIAAWNFDDSSQNGEAGAAVTGLDLSGVRVHTHDPTPGYASHGFAPLREPVTAHLGCDVPAVVAELKKHIPAMGATDYAWRYFQALLELGPAARLEACRWFLRSLPNHPRAGDVLLELSAAYGAAGVTDPVARTEQEAAEADVPPEALFAFHRHDASGARSFIRDWRVLGNITGAGLYVDPTGTGAVFFSDTGSTAAPRGGWVRHRSPRAYVDFASLFEEKPGSIAYAACWLHVDVARPAVVELGSDGACTVWLNRTQIVKTDGQWGALPGDETVPVDLPRGWSEIVFAVEPGRCGWGFYCEVVDSAGRSGVAKLASPP